MVERRAKPQAEEEDEDNTLSLAQMEEALKPMALEKFAGITSLFKKFSKLQHARLDAMGAGAEFAAGRREEISEAVANSSPRKWRASSSTRPRSNIWSTSCTATTAA